MVHIIFTLDYEIYGNGQGSLRDLVVDPTARLAKLFEVFDAPFVVFAEAVELARIEEAGCDPDSATVRAQLRELREAGHEIALHTHPWWENARYQDGRWLLDWSERNISNLGSDRVETIVSSAIRYLRNALGDPGYTPVAYRSGLWAMQPTAVVANVLARNGVQIDSSVFKGGRIGSLDLDYRAALRNGHQWHFGDDVNVSDPSGRLLEIPIHTEMVGFWKMLGSKRIKLQRKAQNGSYGTPLPRRWKDFLRLRYPRKLDFCRMTFEEMRDTTEAIIKSTYPDEQRAVVAIGHSKDFVDGEALAHFLAYLRERAVAIKTFSQVFCPELQLS